MSTKDTTDTLLRELIALDPTFAEKEDDVRTLISLLSERKPVVSINEAFVQNLRTQLLIPHTIPVRSPYQKLNWWAMRLAPIGAIAILFLILMPNGLHNFEEQTMLREEMPSTESSGVSVSDDASFSADAPSAKSLPQSNDVGGSLDNSYSTMEMRMDAQPLAPDRFELGMQQPGISISITSVTLTRPGYMVIHSFGPQGIGPVVGVSPIQNSGTTVGVPVYLRTVTRRRESYYAALYYDNGDGVFSLSDDIPVIDPMLGTPFGVRFTIGVPEAQ